MDTSLEVTLNWVFELKNITIGRTDPYIPLEGCKFKNPVKTSTKYVYFLGIILDATLTINLTLKQHLKRNRPCRVPLMFFNFVKPAEKVPSRLEVLVLILISFSKFAALRCLRSPNFLVKNSISRKLVSVLKWTGFS